MKLEYSSGKLHTIHMCRCIISSCWYTCFATLRCLLQIVICVWLCGLRRSVTTIIFLNLFLITFRHLDSYLFFRNIKGINSSTISPYNLLNNWWLHVNILHQNYLSLFELSCRFLLLYSINWYRLWVLLKNRIELKLLQECAFIRRG